MQITLKCPPIHFLSCLPRFSDRMTHREQSKGDCLVVDLSIDRSLRLDRQTRIENRWKLPVVTLYSATIAVNSVHFALTQLQNRELFFPSCSHSVDRFFHHFLFSLVSLVDPSANLWQSCDTFEKFVLILERI